jgi:hypothetical protein
MRLLRTVLHSTDAVLCVPKEYDSSPNLRRKDHQYLFQVIQIEQIQMVRRVHWLGRLRAPSAPQANHRMYVAAFGAPMSTSETAQEGSTHHYHFYSMSSLWSCSDKSYSDILLFH